MRVDAYVLDNGLDAVDEDADVLHLCSAEPIDYATAVSLSLGSKTFTPGALAGAPADAAPNGRAVTTAEFWDGVASGNGDATHCAIVDSVDGRLHGAGALTQPVTLSAGDYFHMPPFTLRLPALQTLVG